MRRQFLLAGLLSVRAFAAEASAPAPPSSEWNGVYRMATGAALQGQQPVNMNLNDVIIAHLQPWARLKMEATDGIAEDTGGVCQPDGIFRFPVAGATRFLWLAAPDKILMVQGQINTAGVQRIYLNRQHPKNLLPTWNGDSIGHWESQTRENGTLVVDTIGFNDKSWLQPAMQPHSEETHMIQRIRRVNGLIEIVWTIEDRLALTSAYTYSRYYRRVADFMDEPPCAEDVQVWKEYRNKALRPIVERSKKVQ